MEPRVELLWWEGCPSTERALDDLRSALREAGIDPAAIELREVVSNAEVAASISPVIFSIRLRPVTGRRLFVRPMR